MRIVGHQTFSEELPLLDKEITNAKTELISLPCELIFNLPVMFDLLTQDSMGLGEWTRGELVTQQ